MPFKPTFENGFFWNNYRSIESDFLRFLEYTPYCPSNKKMYSPKLTGLLLQIGGYVDSAFKEMAKYFRPYAYKKKRNTRAKRVRPIVNIVDAFAVYETVYILSLNNGGKLIAKLELVADKELYPFASFSSNYQGPQWWEAYNEVKHNYSLHIRKASIDNVLDGLAGALLLNIIHYPSIKLLWGLGNLITGVKTQTGFAELHLTQEQIDKYISSAASKFEPPNIGIRVETPLFLYTRR